MMNPKTSLLITPTSPFSNLDYTVGWICAIPVELQAATLFLDESHGKPQFRDTRDDNRYALGHIAGHKVVLVSMPRGEYGIDSAAATVVNLARSFPNIEFCLMVGVAGGAPLSSHQNQIHLGDVVISEGSGTKHGGVLQYDFNRMHKGPFEPTLRFFNQSPSVLRAALTGLSEWELKYEGGLGEAINHEIHRILESEKIPNRIRTKFSRPDPGKDKLFRSDIVHAVEGCYCEKLDVDQSCLVDRKNRTTPFIHYGLVASSNTLVKDAIARDRFAEEHGVLCFEMEAAGIMNRLPSLVIRGICDYSDSHKNKEWQPYAAMAAAGCAKAILAQVTPEKVNSQKPTQDGPGGIQDINGATHLDRNIRTDKRTLEWILPSSLESHAAEIKELKKAF